MMILRLGSHIVSCLYIIHEFIFCIIVFDSNMIWFRQRDNDEIAMTERVTIDESAREREY